MTSGLLEQNKPQELEPGGDEMTYYLQQIRQFPRLTVEQERELARRCAEGNEEAVRQMVNANLRLVVSVAREYAGRGVPLMDLIQEGSIGLLVAARKFDYTLDYRFSTYATKWIRQGVTRCLMNHAGLIRVPVYTAERMRKVTNARAELLQQMENVPTVEQIAQRCEMEPDKVAQLLAMIPEMASLDAPVGDGEDGTLGILLEDIHAPDPQEELVRRELKHTMELLMSGLSSRQQLVLRLRFGMEDGHTYSLEQIGTMLGVSKERARQIERQALDKLQKLGMGLGLEDFLE